METTEAGNREVFKREPGGIRTHDALIKSTVGERELQGNKG